MIHVEPVASPNEVWPLKKEYIQGAAAPLDGMWLCGFVPQALHLRFSVDGTPQGYCCSNEEGFLLQWYMRSPYDAQSSDLFGALVDGAIPDVPRISGAYASTAEPAYLDLCREHFPQTDVHTLMYELDAPIRAEERDPNDCALLPVGMESLDEMVQFCLVNVGGPEGWLRPYLGTLIERRELFACRRDGVLIGSGESRGHRDFQPEFGDLGVIVDEGERGKGFAAWILRQLVELTVAKGLVPICSTERGNLGAQKAIARAGFVSRNQILQLRR